MTDSVVNPALLLALGCAVLNLGTGLANLAISRAPGWQAARVPAWIALSAACYSFLNVVYCTDGLGEAVYLGAGRLTYLVGGAHVVAWLMYAFGGAEGRLRLAPGWVRWLVYLFAAWSVVLAVSGWHLENRVEVVEVGWWGIGYHYPLANVLGDAHGVLMVLLLGIPFGAMARRGWRGEKSRWPLLVGFGVFLPCAVVEFLVAARILRFVSLSDLGFLVLVLPLSYEMFRRFLNDAAQLKAVTAALAREVAHRTEQRDRTESALAESERLASLGRLAAGVGHEIRNPLSYLLLALDEIALALREAGVTGRVGSALEDARDGARRIGEVVNGLSGFSRPRDEKLQLEVARVVQVAVRMAGPELRAATEVVVDVPSGLRVVGNESRLVQAMVNVLNNAAQAIASRPGPGRVEIHAEAGAGDRVILRIQDNGPGVAEAELGRLTQPYHTTRAAAGALGLGLFMTRGIVMDHAGEMGFESTPGEGLCVRLMFPAASTVAVVGLTGDTTVAVAGWCGSSLAHEPTASGDGSGVSRVGELAREAERGRRRLLIVDDEPALRKLLARVLGRTWAVSCATEGREALELMESTRFDVAICDLMMPGMGGMELARWMETRWPELRRRTVFMTGGVLTAEAEDFLRRPDVLQVSKPMTMPDLEAMLERLVSCERGRAVEGSEA